MECIVERICDGREAAEKWRGRPSVRSTRGNGKFFHLGRRLPAAPSCWRRSTRSQETGRGCTQTSKQFSGWQTLKEKYMYWNADKQKAVGRIAISTHEEKAGGLEVRGGQDAHREPAGVSRRRFPSGAHLHFYTLMPSVCSSSPPLKKNGGKSKIRSNLCIICANTLMSVWAIL